MRGRIPDRFIDELLARVDIVDVIAAARAAEKAGREWTARCPFHDERSPSFYVSPAKQFFHCFGCGAHGSAIRFLMDYERLEFPDAVEELAQSVGLKVPHEGGDERPREDKTDLYALLDAAARFYQSELAANDTRARVLREARAGCSDHRALPHRLGAGRWDGVKSALGTTAAAHRAARTRPACWPAASAARNTTDSANALMFPILDRRGRMIAFGGRVLVKSKDTPKYLNSPETPLFHKGRELFALWQVREANRRSRA